MLASEYLKIASGELENIGVFDAVVDADSNFFINVIRLRNASTPEFKDSYQKINNYFEDIATILNVAKTKSIKDKFYRSALHKFSFSEHGGINGTKGINLGFSKTGEGSAFGPVLTEQVISDAFDIVKAGCSAPEIFHLIGLFEDNVGPDRLSDMIAKLILPDIQEYTKRIIQDLGITPESRTDLYFENGYVINEYKRCPLYLLPIEIIHKLPVAKCWEEVSSVASENHAIRSQLNITVGDAWEKWASSDKKAYIKKQIFMNPEALKPVLDSYKEEKLEELDILADPDYFVARTWNKIKGYFNCLIHGDASTISSVNGAIHVVEIFKDWVENNKGWDEVQQANSRNQEKSVQRLMHLGAKEFIRSANLDLSPESNAGPGPEDFKISRGNDKTVIEVKLSSNNQCKHGYEVQIREYAKAEGTDQMIFVLINVGNDRRVEGIQKLHDSRIDDGNNEPCLMIIDAKPRTSASKL